MKLRFPLIALFLLGTLMLGGCPPMPVGAVIRNDSSVDYTLHLLNGTIELPHGTVLRLDEDQLNEVPANWVDEYRPYPEVVLSAGSQVRYYRLVYLPKYWCNGTTGGDLQIKEDGLLHSVSPGGLSEAPDPFFPVGPTIVELSNQQ